ncbi:MAG TPA: cell division protein FtsQ/DivIB [Paracoccaceae bacterium]|nr:cell division protein FtsQ/DivIB [Paracoccaceae bacterium]
MRAIAPRRKKDPSPSRLMYRLQRFWLKPIVRRIVLKWIPATAVAGVVTIAASNPQVQGEVANLWHTARDAVAVRPELQVRNVDIQGANSKLEPVIRRSLDMQLPVSSLDIDLQNIRQSIEAIDAVKTAQVRLDGGGVLLVEVSARTPVAVWRNPKGLWSIDDVGHRVAELSTRTARADLPLIAGIGAEAELNEAMALYAIAAPLADRMRGLVRIGERRWDIVLDRGQRIMLPESGAATALRRILGIHKAEDLLNRDITVVDARDPRRMTLRLSDNAISELRRLRTEPSGEDA